MKSVSDTSTADTLLSKKILGRDLASIAKDDNTLLAEVVDKVAVFKIRAFVIVKLQSEEDQKRKKERERREAEEDQKRKEEIATLQDEKKREI